MGMWGPRLWLVAFAFFVLATSVTAFCRSDEECRSVSCAGETDSIPLCNSNTKACYCGPDSCGNYACEQNESFKNCPNDCPMVSCGNGQCDGSESSGTCPGDCKPVCGNSVCEDGESVLDCPGDCVETMQCCQWITDAYGGKTGCAQYCAVCGDLLCNSRYGEDYASCPSDCAPPKCGDGLCEEKIGEDPTSCAQDCQAVECKSDVQCVGVGGCDYAVGQDFPAKGETVFNVCACTNGLCETTIQSEGVCGDNFCLNETCNPNSPAYCSGDCGTCKEADLVIKTAAPEKLVVNSGEKVKVNVSVDNFGAAKSSPFTVRVYLKGAEDKPLAEFKSIELPITNLAVDYANIVGYLAAEKARLRGSPGIAWLQSPFAGGVPPNAVLTATPFYGVKPLNVVFDADKSVTEGSEVMRYELDFDGDGTFDVSFQPPATQVSHAYKEAGLYVATLKAVNKEGVGGLDSVRVLVLEQPIQQVVELDTTGLCGAVTFILSIEDVRDADAKNNSKEITLQIVCRREPTPVIRASAEKGAAPLTIAFDAGKSVDEDGSIQAYQWDFGDGEKAEGARVSHVFGRIGEYEVGLRVRDNDGIHGTAKQGIVAGIKPRARPRAQEKTYVNLRTVFDAAESTDDGSIASYEWDFGEEGKIRGARVTHSFKGIGVKKVGLTVTDDSGLKDAAEFEVKVFGSDFADLRAGLVAPLGATLLQNQDYDLRFEVVNSGEKEVGPFKAALFAGGLEGKPVGEAKVDGLQPLESRELAFKVNAGEQLREARYYLWVDAENENKESNEVNNVVEVSKTVSLEEVCGNDLDDNVNGYVDEGCEEAEVEVCGNGVDDNGNGKADEGCGPTEAVISGLPLQLSFERAEPVVGEEQIVRVSHPLLGDLRQATVSIVSPSGSLVKLQTDERGVARYRIEESGKYRVEAYKYTLSTGKEFNGLSQWVASQKQLMVLPAVAFGPRVLEMPLLVMVLLLLSMISMVLAYDRSQALFREELEIVKSPREIAVERGIRLGVGTGFFFVPLVFNKAFGFEAGIATAIIEIVLLYLTLHFEREKY